MISSHILILSSTLRELKVDPLPRQTLIHLGVGIETVIHPPALLLVEHGLEDLAAVLACADALAHDLDGVDKVGEDGVVHGGECAGARALLRLRGAAAVAAFRAGEDAARGDDQDVPVGELLFEFAGQAGGGC